MKTYEFNAFQNQRYAAHGEVQADSAEEAKAKIMELYYEGLAFDDYVEREAPDHIMMTDEKGEEYHLEDETPPDVLKALKALIDKAGDLIAAINGGTDQYMEIAALIVATSAAEKAMQAAGGAS